jgi:hypothetical protein
MTTSYPRSQIHLDQCVRFLGLDPQGNTSVVPTLSLGLAEDGAADGTAQERTDETPVEHARRQRNEADHDQHDAGNVGALRVTPNEKDETGDNPNDTTRGAVDETCESALGEHLS